MVQKLELYEDELDSRAREVLREIIMEHVATGEAISSRSLSKSGRFQLSPASLRNVMADLEELGYLQQPHTSAGRIPTDRGYRFYVDQLLEAPRAPKGTAAMEAQLRRDAGSPPLVEDVLVSVSGVLSRASKL